MKFTPRPYQKLATEFMLDVPRANLWADMGMGKTVSTLNMLNAFKLAGDDEPVLIIAPLRVARGVWPVETQKWDHLRDYKISAVVGTPYQREHALRQRADAYTINYENLPWLFEYLASKGIEFPFRRVIPDEATRLKSMRPSMRKHHKTGTEYVQNQGAKRARQLARVAHTTVKFWDNLTGTPAPQGVRDLWGQQWFIDAGRRLGITHDAFMQRWFQTGYDGVSKPMDFANPQIHDALRDCTLSLRAEDWFDVEKPLVTPVFVDLPTKARKLYREMEKEMFVQLRDGPGIEAFNSAAKTNKCLQLAAGFIYDEDRVAHEIHDEKLEALKSVIEEAAGYNVLVQYHYKPDRDRILKKFPHARQLHTQKDEDEWNAGKIRMLVAHADSCGHGLNLQDGGHILVRFSYWWAREAFDQILERIGPVRQAQSGHNVVVREYRIIARDTVDEDVLTRHETNREVEDILMEAMTRRG